MNYLSYTQTYNTGTISNPLLHNNIANNALLFQEIQRLLVRIEKGTFKVFANKKKPSDLSTEVKAFFTLLSNFRLAYLGMRKQTNSNIYLRLLSEELSNEIHNCLMFSNQIYLNWHYIEQTVKNIQISLINHKAALIHAKHIQKLQKSLTAEYKVLSQLILKYEQLNCTLIELLLYNSSFLPNDIDTKHHVKVIKSFLKTIHNLPILKDKLLNMHWRIVDTEFGGLKAEILIYNLDTLDIQSNQNKVLADEVNKLSAINSTLVSPYFNVTSVECYKGNGVNIKHWKDHLDRCQSVLEYTIDYGENCHQWKVYQGNV